MVDSVSPTGKGSSSDKLPKELPGSGKLHYSHKQIAHIKAMWQPLFPKFELSDMDAQQMNDTFLKNVGDRINDICQWALQQQKERDQQEKEDQNG